MPSTGPPATLARGAPDVPLPARGSSLPADSPLSPPPPWRPTLTKMVDDADEAERERQAQVTTSRGTASKRSATAKSSSEEMKQRRIQREAATAAMKPGAATARLTFQKKSNGPVARMEGAEAALAMQSRATRLPPGVVLQSPHEAAPQAGAAADPQLGSQWAAAPQAGAAADPQLEGKWAAAPQRAAAAAAPERKEAPAAARPQPAAATAKQDPSSP